MGLFLGMDLDLKVEFPSDREHFGEIIHDTNLKWKTIIIPIRIILFGFCGSISNFLQMHLRILITLDSNACTFSAEYYFVTNSTGIKILIIWLFYSIVLNKTYYEIC